MSAGGTIREQRPPEWLLELGRLDAAIFETITQTPTPSLDGAMRKLVPASDYSRLWLGCGAILAATRGRSGRRAAASGLASVAVTSFVVNAALKPLARRRRPETSEVPASRRARIPGSSSFPSGHAASAFAFATGAASVLPCEAIPIRALAAAVAYSRVHIGAHYPADVLAGAFVGTTLAQLTSRRLPGG